MFKYLSRRQEEEVPTMLKDSPFIAYFAKMLLTFFNTQQQIRAKRRAGANHSIKEMELVSRLIYFIRLSMKEDTWTDIENETLKAFLKQYKAYRYPHNISNIYPEFSIWHLYLTIYPVIQFPFKRNRIAGFFIPHNVMLSFLFLHCQRTRVPWNGWERGNRNPSFFIPDNKTWKSRPLQRQKGTNEQVRIASVVTDRHSY